MALISDFLDELAGESGLRDEYFADPKAAMTEFGLNEDQQALILGYDLQALREALQAEVGPKPYIIVHHIVHWVYTAESEDEPQGS